MSTSGFSLIIANDHPLMRAGIKDVVSADRLFNPVACAQSGGECLEVIRRPIYRTIGISNRTQLTAQ